MPHLPFSFPAQLNIRAIIYRKGRINGIPRALRRQGPLQRAFYNLDPSEVNVDESPTNVPGNGDDSGGIPPRCRVRNRRGRESVEQRSTGPADSVGEGLGGEQLAAGQPGRDVAARGREAQRALERLREQREQRRLSLPDDDAFREGFPACWYWFTTQQWTDGRKRQPCTLSVKLSSGGWTFTITDPELRCSKSGFALTWDEIPDRLESLILDDDVPWKTYKEATLKPIKKEPGQGG